jgi:hypothetical protein
MVCPPEQSGGNQTQHGAVPGLRRAGGSLSTTVHAISPGSALEAGGGRERPKHGAVVKAVGPRETEDNQVGTG